MFVSHPIVTGRCSFCHPFLIQMLCVSFLPGLVSPASAGDWPVWGHNAAHTHRALQGVPDGLRLQWSLQLPMPESCWPWNQHRIQFDASYEPVAAEGRLYIPLMTGDGVTARDAATGAEVWRFHAQGPVRFAPLYWRGKLYCVSDDGFLYCLDAATGAAVWTFRGGPSDHRILGNERLISMWPARGAPVIDDEGRVFFAAGIWPFMGIFIHALDAETGAPIWENSKSGSDFILQPHSTPSFAGVAPQGYMTLSEDGMLLVPGGRSVAAGYDRDTGDLIHYEANTKLGGYALMTAGDAYFCDGNMYRTDNGKSIIAMNARIATKKERIGLDSKGRITAWAPQPRTVKTKDKRGKEQTRTVVDVLWAVEHKPPFEQIFLMADRTIYATTANQMLVAVRAPDKATGEKPREARIVWRHRTGGRKAWSMLTADSRLFVVYEDGWIDCFADAATAAPALHRLGDRHTETAPEAIAQAQSLTGGIKSPMGYCLIAGAGDGSLAEALARDTSLRTVVIEPDPKQVAELRRRWLEAGWHGEKLSVMQGRPLDMNLPPYLFRLIVTDAATAAEIQASPRQAQTLLNSISPYGGGICIPRTRPATGDPETALATVLSGAGLTHQGFVGLRSDFALWTREGPLPGAAPWTHHNGDAANTVTSADERVRPPLGLLWFGGSSHMDVLPRHGHGPRQLISEGRLVIQGPEGFSGRDVYTGQTLWQTEIPGLNTFGAYYDESFNPDPYDRSYNQLHIPGASAFGSNFAAADNRVYVANGTYCDVLDLPTGQILSRWRLPSLPDAREPKWGHITVSRDHLIVAAAPLRITKEETGKDDDKQIQIEFEPNSHYAEGSRYLLVLDRHTGEPRWSLKAEYNLRHNAIAVGAGKVFMIDALSPQRMDMMKRRGLKANSRPRLQAYDLRTGDLVWEKTDNVFGTWLGYSAEYDILLQAGSKARDRAGDDIGRGMAAHRGVDGEILWANDRSYAGPCILHGDRIITQADGGTQSSKPGFALSLLTGAPLDAIHPLTGQPIPWEWIRFYGCNTAIASKHLLTFRSASAAFTSLSAAAPGVTPIGGFKSGCTANLVAADGVLNAPDYTRTCTCSYQNQTSLALVHYPEASPDSPVIEEWSYFHLPRPDVATAVDRVGLNFGAPGDKIAADGTLWLDFPSVGGPSPDLPVYVEGGKALQTHRRHSSRVAFVPPSSKAWRWVAASQVEDVRRIRVRPFIQPPPPPADDADPEKHAADMRAVKAFTNNAWKKAFPKAPTDVAGEFKTPRLYTARLIFCETDETLGVGDRVFDIIAQGRLIRKDFDILAEAGGHHRAIAIEAKGLSTRRDLEIECRPSDQTPDSKPLIAGVEWIAE